MILIDLYVNDEYLKKKLVEVVTMTHSYIERRENDFKHEIEIRDQKLEIANMRISEANRQVEDANMRISEANRQVEDRDELLVEIAHDIDDNGELNEDTLQKLRVITKGI